MDLEIKKEEYLEYLYKYIERDKKLYLGFLKTMKKSSDLEWLYILKEMEILSENLKRNIQLYYATKTSDGNLEFYLDIETNQPIRHYKVDETVKDKIMKRLKKKDEKEIKNMFG